MKLTTALPSGIVPGGEPGRKLPPPSSSLSPKEIGKGSMTVTDSGFGPEPENLSQESRAPSVSPVAKGGSHLAWHHRISSDQSQNSDDNQLLEDSQHLSPPEVLQWSGSPGYEPSFVTGDDQIVMTIHTSGAKVDNPQDTHSQVDSVQGSKQRDSSLESDHETSITDSTKKKKRKKKHKKHKSGDRSPAPRAISFSMHKPPGSMVKDYNWMLTDTAGDTVPDQSNPKVIIVNEPPECDEASHHDQLLGNPLTYPGDMVTSPYGHGGVLPPGNPWGSGDGDAQKEEFSSMVQTLEGFMLL